MRHKTRAGTGRAGASAAKVTPPAKKPWLAGAPASTASRCARTTDSGTRPSKPASAPRSAISPIAARSAIVGFEQGVERLAEGVAPCCETALRSQRFVDAEHRLREPGQAREEERIAAFDGRDRRDPGKEIGLAARCCVAEEEPLEPRRPRVGALGRQAEPQPGGLVAPPAHGGVAHPVAQRHEIRDGEPETPRHDRELEERQHLLRLETAVGQREQRREGARHPASCGLGPVGDRVGNAPRVRRRAEDRVDERRVERHVGHQHQDVRGAKGRIAGEPVEQLVVQNLDLARRRVAHMEGKRPVGLAAVEKRRALVATLPQREDVGLKGSEQRPSGLGGVHVAAPGALRGVGDAVDQRPAVLPERSEQSIARLAVLAFAGAAGAGARDPARVLDERPILAAGINQPEAHVAMRADAAEGVQMQRRQRLHREEMQALWKLRPCVFAGVDRGEKPLARLALRRLRQFGEDLPPQRRLPRFIGPGSTQLAAGPRIDELGAIDEIAIERGREPLGELIRLLRIAVGEVAREPHPLRVAGEAREQRRDPPLEHFRRERRGRRHGRHHARDQLPDVARSERETQVRPHPERVGERQGQPARHAGRADHDGLGHERRQGCIAHQVREAAGQHFDAVGLMDLEHGGLGIRRGAGLRANYPPRGGSAGEPGMGRRLRLIHVRTRCRRGASIRVSHRRRGAR